MNLREYWTTRKGDARQGEFAKRLGISDTHFSRLLSGERLPSRALARLIEEETGGLVPATGWDGEPLSTTSRGAAKSKTKASECGATALEG